MTGSKATTCDAGSLGRYALADAVDVRGVRAHSPGPVAELREHEAGALELRVRVADRAPHPVGGLTPAGDRDGLDALLLEQRGRGPRLGASEAEDVGRGLGGEDRPGMIGRVGSVFGEHGVNIVSAAVGAREEGEEAVMAVTTDRPVPEALIREIAGLEGFHYGRAASL